MKAPTSELVAANAPAGAYTHGRLPPGVTRNRLHSTTHVPTSPEKRRLNQLAYYRSLVEQGDEVRAAEYARKYALEVPLADLADELVGDTPPVAPLTAPPIAPPPPASSSRSTNWPETARVVVWTTCPNPRLVVARLPDGRTVGLWREGLPPRPVGIECNVHIEKRTGDPIYRLD